MKNARKVFGIILISGILLSTILNPVLAQEPYPRSQESNQSNPDGIWLDPDTDFWVSSGNFSQLGGVSLTSNGGPDDYGYTWNSTVLTDWVDATDGTALEIFYEPISLPFSFKYYEGTYSAIYIAKDGYITFIDEGMWLSQPRIPNPTLPNTIIAPYAAPINPTDTGTTNRVYFRTGGIEPDRYFVIEWYQVISEYSNYTFEVILYENGDIVFQYQTMDNGNPYWCGTSGIEDSTGLSGLIYTDFCLEPPSNTTVRFIPPSAQARIRVLPTYQGGFISRGNAKTFTIDILNLGELGNDTYDITTNSVWPVTYASAETDLPLDDTDGDGITDTGLIPEGTIFKVNATIQAPLLLDVGDFNTSTIIFTSSLNPAKNKTSKITLTVPAAFAQIFTDSSNGAISLEIIQRDSVIEKQITPENYWPGEVSLAEKQEGFINSWNRPNDDDLDLEYSVTDRSGENIRSITTLRNNTSTEFEVHESSPEMASAPDGRIGLTWHNQIFDPVLNEFQENIYFAIMDADGNIIVDPTNLTINTTWGEKGDSTTPFYSTPNIAATDDNRFVITWQTEYGYSSDYVSDIWFAILDPNGGVIHAPAQITFDSPGYSGFYQQPAITKLSDHRIAIAWYQRDSYIEQAAFTILDSSGTILHGITGLGKEVKNLDLVQLSTGTILIAGMSYEWGGPWINFSLISGTTYLQNIEFTTFNNYPAYSGNGYVSVTADQDGHGILTWMDYSPNYRKNLYYSLLSGFGNLTPPVIFQTSDAAIPNIYSSITGFGNTSFSVGKPIPIGFDLNITTEPEMVVLSGGSAEVSALVQNVGLGTADPVTLKAYLDPALTVVSANPAPSTVVDNVFTWVLPSLDYLESQAITLNLTVPEAAEGTEYWIIWATVENDIHPDDNIANQQLVIGPKVFLPLILR